MDNQRIRSSAVSSQDLNLVQGSAKTPLEKLPRQPDAARSTTSPGAVILCGAEREAPIPMPIHARNLYAGALQLLRLRYPR